MTAGEVVAGKYQLSSLLARGGMGAVWRARHLLLDIDVAVKLMAPTIASSPEQRARFAKEARASAQIKSPHVVQIHDYGLDDDTPYIVMELLDGEDLGARLRRDKRLSPAVAAILLIQIGRGLRKAHDMGIVHRDLKPANLFLSKGDEDEVVKILDFGIARANISGVTGETTNTGEILGSPPYMSPEQVRGQKSLDHRTDLWSLGVVLYRMLTGRLPFQSEQAGDLLVRICTEDAPAPSTLAPELSPAIDAFFRRVLERDPNARFASVREMVEAFVQAAAPAPRPPAPSSPFLDAPYVPVGKTTVPMLVLKKTVPIVPAPASASRVPATLPIGPSPQRAAPLPVAAAPVPSLEPTVRTSVVDPDATLVEAGTLTGGASTLPMRPQTRRATGLWVAGASAAALLAVGIVAVMGFGGARDEAASASTVASKSDGSSASLGPTAASPPAGSSVTASGAITPSTLPAPTSSETATTSDVATPSPSASSSAAANAGAASSGIVKGPTPSPKPSGTGVAKASTAASAASSAAKVAPTSQPSTSPKQDAPIPFD